MRICLLCLLWLAPACAGWLEHVAPIMTPDERKIYVQLRPEARAKFEDNFWASKQISAEEYERRLAYVESTFGSVHADRGRIYLSLGAPSKISRLPSTRSFWPLEIWYYDTAPTIGVSSALQFLFFQRNQAGDYRLYSPTLDTFTTLLNPQSGTRGMFRTNDILSENDIRSQMNLSPAETEIVDAALAVGRGIKGSGNEEILGLATSPSTALSKTGKFSVTSRLLSALPRPVFSSFISWSEDGVPVVDLLLETPLQSKIGVSVSTEESETTIAGSSGRKVRYQHRLALLPGSYTVVFTVDGVKFPFPLDVPATRETSAILVGDLGEDQQSPFEFGPAHLTPSASGHVALVQLAGKQLVKWRLRQNANELWSGTSEALPGNFAMTSFNAPPGRYTLEMRAGPEFRERSIEIGGDELAAPVISYNANLAPGLRARSIGRQWLARGRLIEARAWLERARGIQPSDAISIDLSRVAALAGDLDTPRQTLRKIVARAPDSFEALTLLGFIEAQLQDYAIAAQYYRQALAVRASPEVAQALAQVSHHPQ